LQQTLTVNDINPQNTKLFFTQLNIKMDMQKKFILFLEENIVHIVYTLNKKLPLLRC